MIELMLSILTLPIFTAVWLTMGVAEVVTVAGSGDVSKDSKFEYLIGQTFETKEDMYYLCYNDNPSVWYLNSSYPRPLNINDPSCVTIYDEIVSGTKITVTKIYLKKSVFSGNRYTVYGTFSEHPYQGNMVVIDSFFDYDFNEYPRMPLFNDNKAKIVSKDYS